MTLWNRCIRDLQAELPEQQFNTWIRPLQAEEDGSVLRLFAPNHFVVDWLQEHYIDRIEKIVGDSGTAEQGEVEQVLKDPQHEYTKRLLAAVPKLVPPERMEVRTGM